MRSAQTPTRLCEAVADATPGRDAVAVVGDLLPILAAHLLMTALPGAAATLLAARSGVKAVPVLLAIGLALSAATALLTFWAYYADPLAGETFSYLILFGSIALSAWCLRGGRIASALLRRLATPLALWALGSTFLIFLGFMHGGADDPLATAAARFNAGPLPSDSYIPYFYSEWFFEHGHRGDPPVFGGEWLSSDRPPLQVGYILSQRPLSWSDTELHYQVLGVVLQQLWIVGLWALLLASRVGRVTRWLAVVAVLVSNLALVHGFFVWPKMLPTALLLAAAALVITPLWDTVRRDWRGAALVAGLFGLAMLAHGSSVFAIVPLALIAAIRALPSWRWIGVAVAVGLALMVPWSAYQSYGDPPGNRLTKWLLGGAPGLDDRTTMRAIKDGYREAGIGGTLQNKVDNFARIAGVEPGGRAIAENGADALASGDLTRAVRELRSIYFLFLLPSFGLLLIAPFVMLARRRQPRADPQAWVFAITCFAAVAIGGVFWALVLFGNPAAPAVIHAGSLLLPVLGFCGAVAALRATLPRFAVYYVALNAVLTLAVYVPAVNAGPGTGYSVWATLIAAISLGAFGWLAFQVDDPADHAPLPA